MPDKKYRYEDGLRGLLDYLGIEETIVVGSSVGGGIATNFTLNYPHRVSDLILMDTFLAGFDWPNMLPKLKLLGEIWKRGNIDKTVEIWVSMDWFDNIKKDNSKYERLGEMVKDNAKRLFGQKFLPLVDWGAPMTDRLNEIKAPTLIMVGGKDTPDNHKVAEIIKEKVAQSRFYVVPNSGHIMNIENPSFVNKQTIKYLRENIEG